MLTETEAYALLEQHCGALREPRVASWAGIDYDRRSEWTKDGCAHVDLVARFLWPGTESERDTKWGGPGGRDMGARMRLALGVAQAVSHCRGFEPSTHQRFWRHVVKTLWFGPQHGGIIDTLALSPMAFDHVKIFWRGRTFFDEAFWIGFLHGTPECDAALSSVLETLKPHTASGQLPPPLKVSLAYGSQGDWVAPWGDGKNRSGSLDMERLVTPEVLKIILRAALDPLLDPWLATPTHLGLVVEYRVGDNAYLTHEALDLLAQARTLSHQHSIQITIERLTVVLAPLIAPRRATADPHSLRAFVTRARELGRVLRNTLLREEGANRPSAFPRIPSVVLLGCSQSDYRLVGAALSAVASASRTIASLRCSDICDQLQPLAQNLRLAWLVYAIYTRGHRRLTATSPPLALSLLSTGVLVVAPEKTRLQQLLVNGTPLREVVDDALRLRFGDDTHHGSDETLGFHVSYLRVGSTVQLLSRTRLYCDPARVTDDFIVATLGVCEEELDVVSHVIHGTSDYVGVVYPGYGLVWVTAESVQAWRRVDAAEAQNCSRNSVASLSLTFNSAYSWACDEKVAPPAHHVSAALALLAFESLASLALELAVVKRDDLALLLARCPRLRSLTLVRCIIESLAPLAHAFSPSQSHRTRIASLSLLGIRDFRLRDVLIKYGRHHPLDPHNGDGSEHDGGVALALLTPMLDAFASGATHGVLQELQIDLMGLKTADAHAALTRIVTAVASRSSTSLTRLHVACRGGLFRACNAQLGPLRDVVVADPLRVRLAILSVLRALGCEARDIAREVLELVKGNVVRTVTWECAYR